MIVGGGLKAILSVVRYARRIGPIKLYRAVTSKNACKACAFGTGGQNGGLHNEAKRGIEICNKNIQAHLSDIREGIPPQTFLEKNIEALSMLSGKQLEDLGRLTLPLYKQAGDHYYSPVTYERALALLAERLKEASPERSFFYASGRSSNEAAFTLQLLARLYGTNNINNCSYYCHQASGEALSSVVGTGTATIRYDDLDLADTIFVFGANPASNHPRFVKTLIKCRRRGGNVIVVNPASEPGMRRFASPSDWVSMMKGGESIASHYVQPHLAGDLAFLQGVAKWLLANDGADQAFIEMYTSGFVNFAEKIKNLRWEDIVAASGVSQRQMVEIAELYKHSSHSIFTWSMGLTHHVSGVATIETLAALALMRGMIGKPGAGLMPLRGHSNIQGTGSMGFTPALKHAVEEKIEAELGYALPKQRGLDTMACMEAAHSGAMDVAVMLGGNLLASNPDTEYARQAMNAIPLKCFINSTMNMSHVHGVEQEVLILPMRVRDEEAQATTQESMFNFVRLSDGGINRFKSLMSEVEIICALADKLIDKRLFDFSLFKSHERIRNFIGKVVPGFTKLSAIGESKEEFHIEGRTYHTPHFSTEDGKAHLNYHRFSPRPDKVFMLTSVRSEGQFNSIIFDERDTYRGQPDRWVVLMNSKDIAALGLKAGDKVNISTKTGRMSAVRVSPFDVRQGNVMTYYPEANILIPRTTDSRSKTPAFKSVAVDIQAC